MLNKRINKKGKGPLGLKIKINIWKVFLAFLIFILLAPVVLSLFQSKIDSSQIGLSQALSDVKEDKIKEVIVYEEKLVFNYRDGSTKISTKEKNISFPELLDRAKIDPKGVNYKISDQTVAHLVGQVLNVVLPLGLMAAFFFFILKAQNKGV